MSFHALNSSSSASTKIIRQQGHSRQLLEKRLGNRQKLEVTVLFF